MVAGIVIPVGAGRTENLELVLDHVLRQSVAPAAIVVVGDGPEALAGWQKHRGACTAVTLPKHEPGMEQPRNEGVRVLREVAPQATHVWFLDSDVIVGDDCLEQLQIADRRAPYPRILVAPYDWMGPGMREPSPELRNDPRWPSFDAHGPEGVTGDLSAGLACFSGNLVWPIKEFERVGGFWNEIHHGRCEDGELGLRAVAMGVPIGFVATARGWHLWHPVNTELAHERNARDVPMLNARHPWVEGADVFVVEEDGRRFNVRCPGCGGSINTVEWWQHAAACGVSSALPVAHGA